MLKALQVRNLTNWIKVFTYVSATVLLIANNTFDKLTYLIPILIVIFFINYWRDNFLVSNNKPIHHIWISIALELMLIISISFIDKNDINLLLFYICVSSTTIIHPFRYSISLVVAYIASMFFIYAMKNGFTSLTKSIIPMVFNYGVSIAFVVGMSYLVKLQIREKEKLGHMNDELEQAYKKLIENSAASQKLSVEQERTRMAREIHDTLAHTLTTLIVQLEVCKKLAALDPSRLPTELEKAQELSRSGFNDVKRSIKALRPQAMEEKSFFASVASIVNETMESTNVHITLDNLLSKDIKLQSQIEVALFRVIQESITNAIRHGQADEIKIHIKKDNSSLKLCIVDNGAGCINIKKGYGMKGIQERIEGLNGRVEFSSSQGNGFKTEVSIPYEVV
ncbi:sensor histidine kinase [Clostridium malenominatum]|uniref:histidine kinase n=1 Tax=Clostridium malenominatum TaxID=1539 RepID=A0ABN1J0E0_9CLOT